MFGIPYNQSIIGSLIFIRVGGIFFSLPIFGDDPVPLRVRALLSVAVAFVLFPVVVPQWFQGFPKDGFEYLFLVVKELMIGLITGYIARLVFDGFVMSASVVGYQMGFGTANLMIPDAKAQMNSFTAMHRIFLMLIFLSLNLHHNYIYALSDSFRLIPSGGFHLNGEIGLKLIEVSAGVFITAVKLAAPVLVALMFTMAALGLIARTVPQMNIFTMSFPTSFFIGLLVYIASLPYFPQLVKKGFSQNIDLIRIVLKLMGS